MTDIGAEYLGDLRDRFVSLRGQCERAAAQVGDDAFFAAPDAETNSIAINFKHVGGNLRSRFTDFLTSDGEKPDRDRDGEFELKPETTRADLLARWEEGFRILFAALDELTEDDLTKTVPIRAEPHTVVRALDRSLTHTAYHVGQIVFLAKHLASERWQTLSVPRGGTRAFNEKMFAR